MLKKILLYAFTSVLAFTTIVAQQKTNIDVLKKIAEESRLSEIENRKKAFSLAKSKGWETIRYSKDGSVAMLVGVDQLGYPMYLTTFSNLVAAATTRANQLWVGGSSGLNLSGSSSFLKNKLAIWDGGKILDTHQEFGSSRVTQMDNPSSFSDHATHVLGTMMATGVNPEAKGMSFGLTGALAYDFNSDFSEMTTANTGGNSLLISNHSYGTISGWYRNPSQSNRWEFYGRANENEDFKFGLYSDATANWDGLAYEAPYYLIVKSAGNNRNDNGPAEGQPYFRFNASGVMESAGVRPAGIANNDGYEIIGTTGNAKNILTVGAVNGIPNGYFKKEDVVMSSFSSWGPTDDGRIKPDIVAHGVNVLSTVASGVNNYGSQSGTSMASPNVTGSLLLLQEHFGKLKNGTAFMYSATLKGLAIHTADEAGDDPGPDYKFGWGLLNVEKAAAVISAAVPSNNSNSSKHLLYENVLTNGNKFTKTVVASGAGKLVATICWTDPKSTASNALNDRTPKLVNDLDIRIRKGTTTYFPWKLNPTVPASAATRGDNNLDNVEKIEIDDVIPGETYTIEVSHKGNVPTQNYSLIVSGVGGIAYCSSTATSTVGTKIDSVGFAGIRNKNITGCTSYNNYTNLTGNIQPNQTLPITVRLASCDASTNNKMVKVFIDYNVDGDFDDAGELAASSGSITAIGTFTANITTPSTLTIGTYTILRIVTQETNNIANINSCGTYSIGETQDYRILVTAPSNDLTVTEIISPTNATCESGTQLLTIKVLNKGNTTKSNIPVTATVKNGATTIATLNGVITNSLSAGASVNYTFQTTYATSAATTYTITATVTDASDQFPLNNTVNVNVTSPARPVVNSATAKICSPTQINLKVNNPASGTNYYWFNTPNATSPIASGATTSVNTTLTNNTVYVQSGYRGTVGALTKNALGAGGYNLFNNIYVKVRAETAITIETAKLYIANPGTIEFILGTNLVTNGNSFTYNAVDNVVLNVTNTTANAQGTLPSSDDPSDQGAVYTLDLNIPSAGDYIILIRCTDA
ncbi:MAG: S8 family serine peptidase, partial [Chitinophagaceae bacterium]